MTNVGPVSFKPAFPLEKRGDALDAFTRLINEAVTYTLIKGFDSSTHALAFLIEHTSQEEIEILRQRISECKPENPGMRAIKTNARALTWMIQEKVAVVYIAYLDQRISQFDEEKDYLQKILALKEKSSFEDMHQELERVHEKGVIIPGFAIWNKEYLPQWYLNCV
ncbi:MAG: hypothetical protein K940chlam8_00443 [Chlamydiae bacterium]|nr:hypothetical protein [Chlamydiota bacterium]